ncbi:MAG: RluA family pseudouridine synthase [Chloroflexota bacterium]|nr:RluA family pseudouridine synthase [Chloroflexota bacterium]
MKINIIAKRIERLDKLISSNTDFSRSEVVEIIEKNCCVVDGKIQNKKSTIISPDSKIEILSVNSYEKKTYKKINTYLVDEDIIVVEKPANMITHRASKNNDVSLCEHIVNSYPEIKSVGDIDRPGIVHRLDKDTSGLMIIARSANAYEKLKEMIKERSISRNYEALVYGKPKLKEAIIDAPIIRDPKNPIKRRVFTGGKESKTSYRIKKNFEEYSLLDVKLFSGRTHQIRVHLEHVGHPVVGDNLYGNKKSKLKRSFLHSSKLEFFHPMNNKKLYFESPLPLELKKFIETIS